MTDYIITGGFAVAATVVLYGIVRWRFGNGLLSRLFSVVMPSISICAFIGVVLGKQGISAAILTVTMSVATLLIILMII